MNCSRSFIDVLFILLIGAIVMLSNATPLGSVDAAPAAVEKDSAEPLTDEPVRVVIVRPDTLVLDDVAATTADELAARLVPGDRVLLVSGVADLRHQRMMTVWSDFSRRGWTAQIGVAPGAQPASNEPSPPAFPAPADGKGE
jgi:biopolymer transport protein ExbD